MDKIAFIQLSLAMIIVGTIGFFSRLSGLPSMELVFIRCVSAALFLAAYWFFSGRYKKEKWGKREVPIIVLGGVLLVLNWILFFASFEHTAITIVISIYNLAPIIVLVISWIFLKAPIQGLGLLSVILAFIGSLFTSGLTLETMHRGQSFIGPLDAAVAAFFYAFVILTGKKIRRASPYAVTLIQTLTGVVMLFPFVDYSLYTQLTLSEWFYSIVTGVVHTGIVYLLFYGGIRRLKVTTVSALTYLDPLVAILIDILISGFIPSRLQIFGIVVIFVALSYTLFNHQSKQAAKTARPHSKY
ncbi:DMT family transporter [Sporolactobacillus shoreae]|uniref:DMT family transporter n=1 Tax=Sporolactobacillus shoreae TaxID=1465501 RepID=A0A4Z0GS36_9BACL|nr:DMT family transporter [Sporolactobacillus shoreae]TGA98991.1 DMT family transporter [Sporolactobacillus shoreae]